MYEYILLSTIKYHIICHLQFSKNNSVDIIFLKNIYSLSYRWAICRGNGHYNIPARMGNLTQPLPMNV